jgi:uncharacterized protein (DUF302 family)
MKFRPFLIFLTGLMVGFFVFFAIIRIKTPDMMFRVYKSRFPTIEETTAALEKSIHDHGWSLPMIRDLNQCMETSGVQMDTPFRVVEICSPKYAKSLLESNPELSALMPCAWGIYYGKNGKVHISGLNTKYMGRLFGGNINKVMGSNISIEEAWMLDGIVER